jgi:hypothetical protein
MKTAKSTSSPVHSQRTEVEQDHHMRTKSIHTILGLDIEGTLMRMDEEGICHITIAHSDPGYCERAIKYLQKLHIQGHQLDWEGDIIALTSIRLTQRDHPTRQQVLRLEDEIEFPPLLGVTQSMNTGLEPPEIVIGHSDASSSVASSTSETEEPVHHDNHFLVTDLVDTDNEQSQSEHDAPMESAVTFQDAPAASSTNPSASSSATSGHSLVSPNSSDDDSTPKKEAGSAVSRDSTVYDIDTNKVTMYQRRSTATQLEGEAGVWVTENTVRQPTVIDHNRHRDEALENAQEYFGESEDDANTISSDKTSHYKNRAEANKQIAPASLRYQFGFQVDDQDLDSMLSEFADTSGDIEFPDTFSKTKALFTSFFKQAKCLDNEFAIISWADADVFDMITKVSDIPLDAVQFSKFFKGFRPRQLKGRMYVKLRLHAPTIGQPALLQGMREWSSLYGGTFYQTVIQADNATSIGWFVYSSQHSNVDSLMSHLSSKTGYEWGCKLGACTATDSTFIDPDEEEPVRTAWKDRIKALFVYVPHDRAMEAKSEIALFLEVDPSTADKSIPSLSEKFLFMHPERHMADEPSRIYYQQMVMKQRSHNKHLQLSISTIFDVPSDEPILTRTGEYTSLRKIVMSIRVSNKNSAFYKATLFHGLDYTADCSTVYIRGLPGPGGPAYLFSYYAPMAEDAEEMIQGLGVYAGRLYGNRAVAQCFTTSHWNGCKGWKWDKARSKFDTPNSRQQDANLRFDPNLAIAQLALMDLEEAPLTTATPQRDPVSTSNTKTKKKRSRKKRGTSSKVQPSDDDSATVFDPLKAKESNLLQRVVNPETDSQVQGHSAGHVKEKITSQVIFPTDAASVASTLTAGSINSLVPTPPSNPGNDTSDISLHSATSSLKTVTDANHLNSLYEVGMTPEAFRARSQSYYQHQVTKAQLKHTQVVEEFITSLPPSSTIITPRKNEHASSSEAGHAP